MLKKYIVRYSKDYSIQVSAINEETAYRVAATIPEDRWDMDLSEFDAEEV